MKKTLMTLLMIMMTAVIKAQIWEGGYWYNGTLCYTAKNMAGGKVLMNAMAEGEEHEFVLVPVAGKKDVYTVANGENDYVNVYSDIATVRHQKKDGWDVLCFYNDKNLLLSVMSNEANDAQEVSIAKFKNQLMYEYEIVGDSDEELKIGFNWSQVSVNLELASYEVQTFNGMVLGYISISPIVGSTNRLEGTWEVVQTLDGIRLYGLSFDEESNWWNRDGNVLEFRKANRMMRRFGYTSTVLLNDRRFRYMSKPTLRIMRNEILASHGYRFQSKDLQDYFSKQAWYKPAQSNDDIKLSFIEQLNVELIKAEEAIPDKHRFPYVKE